MRANAVFALGHWHWSFLAQPAPLPEQMILANPDVFWISARRLGLKVDKRYPREVLSAYRAQCADPMTVGAICEDHRAGATVDRRLDDADRGQLTIARPVLRCVDATARYRGSTTTHSTFGECTRQTSPAAPRKRVALPRRRSPVEVAEELLAFFV